MSLRLRQAFFSISWLTTTELCSKFLLISWEKNQSLRRSLRSLTFSKVLLTAQQLQRTSLRISYANFPGKPKSEVLVKDTCWQKSTTARQGSLKATFAYDSLTDCLRRAYGNFRSPIRILWVLVWCSNNTVKKVAFAQACFPYMQWHNGKINHRHSIACNSMHQMKHTTSHNLVWAPALMARHGLTNGLRQHVCDQCLRQTFRTAYETQGKSYDLMELFQAQC